MAHESFYNPSAYAAEGDKCSKHGDWSAALENYQKALACMPILYGIQPWFQQYLLDGHQPASLTKSQSAAIYTSLAHALLALNRLLDAHIAADAALRIDASNQVCKDIFNATVAAVSKTVTERRNASGGASQRGTPSLDPDGLTLIFITHFTTKLLKYAELSPPSTNLLAATYGSLLQVFGEEIKRYPRLICYDRNPISSTRDPDYALSLKTFARQQGFDFVQFEHAGLRAILNTILSWIKTPLVMIVEHDWFFKGPTIPLGTLVNLFYQDPRIHTVRFNQRRNRIERYDFIMEAEDDIFIAPLLRTPAYSNNPALYRTSTLRDEWLPLCLNDPLYSHRDLRGTAYGIEEPLFKQHIHDIRCMGFDKAQLKWGSYVYGSFDDPARIVHLGE